MILTDKYGKTLNVGTRVAFNLSGGVCIGYIEKISPRTQYGRTHEIGGKIPYVTVLIKELSAKHPSNVKNVDGIISLE